MPQLYRCRVDRVGSYLQSVVAQENYMLVHIIYTYVILNVYIEYTVTMRRHK